MSENMTSSADKPAAEWLARVFRVTQRLHRCLTRWHRVQPNLGDMRARAADPAYPAEARAAYARNADEAEADMHLKEAEAAELMRQLDELTALPLTMPVGLAGRVRLLRTLYDLLSAQPVRKEE